MAAADIQSGLMPYREVFGRWICCHIGCPKAKKQGRDAWVWVAEGQTLPTLCAGCKWLWKPNDMPKKKRKMSIEVANVLKKALENLGPNGERWARDDGKVQAPESFCSSTAISTQPCGIAAERAREVLCSVIGVSNAECRYLWEWNDNPNRTWADVKDAYEKAIAKEESL